MKDVVKETLARPIATAFIIYAFGSAIASIISATKGTPFKPFIDVSFYAEQNALRRAKYN